MVINEGREGKMAVTDHSPQERAGETHLLDEVQVSEIVGFYETSGSLTWQERIKIMKEGGVKGVG